MKIAVTGSSGFVGSRLFRKLIELNHEVFEIDITNGTDILDWAQLEKISEFDLLIHLAAQTFVPESYKRPRQFYFTNIVGTINALELCRIHKAKIIYTSSYVYGNPNYLPVDETHPAQAFNPYSESKIIGERLCKRYHLDFGLKAIILRPFNIYGPGQNNRFLISSIVKQARKGDVVLKDPLPKRDLLYVDDMIEAYIKAIQYEAIPFDIFNIGFGKSYSIKEIIDEVVKNFNTKFQVQFTGERRKNEIDNVVADISKAEKLLNWKPKVSFEDGIKSCVHRGL